MSTDRLEAFSDGVIAIIITVMVLEPGVLFEERDVKEAVRLLMLRDPKHELHGLNE